MYLSVFFYVKYVSLIRIVKKIKSIKIMRYIIFVMLISFKYAGGSSFDLCIHDGHCGISQTCTYNKCTCVENMYTNRKNCFSVPKDGHHKTIKMNVETKCNYGYYISGNKCKPINLNGNCIEDTDCGLISSAVCRKNKCQCSGNYFNITSSKCLKYADNILDKCQIDKQCSKLPYTQCNSVTCVCIKNYKEDKKQCKAEYLGLPCQKNDDCSLIKHSECLKNSCTCIESYINNENFACLKVANKLREECEIDAQCTKKLKNSECINQKCFCLEKHFTNNEGMCLPEIGASCDDNADIQNTICEFGKLKCLEGYKETTNNQECLPTKLFKQCTTTRECHHFITHARCNGTCVCMENYVGSVFENKCLKVATNFTNICEEDVQCKFNRGLCLNKTCVPYTPFQSFDNSSSRSSTYYSTYCYNFYIVITVLLHYYTSVCNY